MDRVPLSFKTKFAHGTVHRHIVLAVRYAGHWGALGISRRCVRLVSASVWAMCGPCVLSVGSLNLTLTIHVFRTSLMSKPVRFSSLADLVEEYRVSYEECYHKVGWVLCVRIIHCMFQQNYCILHYRRHPAYLATSAARLTLTSLSPAADGVRGIALAPQPVSGSARQVARHEGADDLPSPLCMYCRYASSGVCWCTACAQLNPFYSPTRLLQVRVYGNAQQDVAAKINKFTANMSRMNEYFLREGCLPSPSAVRR